MADEKDVKEASVEAKEEATEAAEAADQAEASAEKAQEAAEVAKEAAKETIEVKEEKKEVPAKFKKLVEEIETMSVIELSELVKALEDRFGVTAAAPVAMMAGGGASGGEDAAAEEKSAYTIHLAAAGDQKINVIKAVKDITGLGLADAKALVDGAPKDIKNDVPKEEAEAAKKTLEEAGATVELK